MSPMHGTLTEADPHSEEVRPEETHNGLAPATIGDSQISVETALPEETPNHFKGAVAQQPPANPETLEEAARKQEKKKLKAQKKAEQKEDKKPKNKLKEKKSSAKELAVAFPMVELIDEQVRTSIP